MNYFNAWGDVYRFHKKYSQIKNEEKEWELVINEAYAISKKYDSCKFIRDLLLVVIDEIERRCVSEKRL